MVWQFDENFPIYRQVINRLRGDILSGVIKPGETLPTVRCLASEAGINPNTAQRALSSLESMGLAVCYSTAGRKVTTKQENIEMQRKKAVEDLVEFTKKSAKEIGLTPEEFAALLTAKE